MKQKVSLYISILVFTINYSYGITGKFQNFKNNLVLDKISNTNDTLAIKSNKTVVVSENPIITHIRCADPAAEVWNDGKVWIYSSHDEDDATDYSTIDGYHVFSSGDLVNWTDHGEILNSDGVDWGNPNGGFMFAPDAAYKNGIYYLYFPHLSNEWKWRIGVATSTKPEGPFTDVGHFIEGTDNIDPVCFMDDDGQAYLIWGGGSESPKMARLKENMTELAEEPRIIEYGASNFGEGPYMHKRNGIYYFSYTCNTCYPYQGFYAVGDNPYGPFEYKGELNPIPPGAQDHHSIIEFHGQWYYFYHVGNYGADGSLYRRNICVDSLYYNEDGTLKEIVQTTTGVGADLIGSTPGKIVPGRIEAEEFFLQQGVDTMQLEGDTTLITEINDGDWFDFVIEILGSEMYTSKIKIDNAIAGTEIYVSVDEKVYDTIQINSGADTITATIYLYKGKHTLKFLFSNAESSENLMDVDWIDIYGDTEYFSIEASVSIGGSIEPEGLTYHEKGDSAIFKIETDFNYIFDSLFVDGVVQELSDSFSFCNITSNHTIQAKFSECINTVSSPYYQINNNAVENGTEISVTETDDLRLIVECEDSCDLLWVYPNGESFVGDELIFDSITTAQKGIYTAKVINTQGCVTEYLFNVLVAYFDLDVFEAESFFNQSGIGIFSCNDLGGGSFITSIENNDYCFYRIKVDSSGYYDLVARVATAQSGGDIEVSSVDSIIATINVEDSLSNGEQDWYTTDAIEIPLEEGYQRLEFTFKGEEGYLFNFNWFDLTYSRPLTDNTTTNKEITINSFPNPFVSSTQIVFSLEESSIVDLDIFNSSGAKIKSLISSEKMEPGTYTRIWNIEGGNGLQLKKGIYFIRFQSNNTVFVKKVVFK